MDTTPNYVLQIRHPNGQWNDAVFRYYANGREASHVASEKEREFNLENGFMGDDYIFVRAKPLRKVNK
jgi:hypothetical protein